ncbi:hypothetical protein Ais01nite_37060 [Asanoa ishikariensis]|nr:hypothetical protein Ais01nite_37060 [Asanoa ishikariensis]
MPPPGRVRLAEPGVAGACRRLAVPRLPLAWAGRTWRCRAVPPLALASPTRRTAALAEALNPRRATRSSQLCQAALNRSSRPHKDMRKAPFRTGKGASRTF